LTSWGREKKLFDVFIALKFIKSLNPLFLFVITIFYDEKVSTWSSFSLPGSALRTLIERS
jgi:hypothetical protein